MNDPDDPVLRLVELLNDARVVDPLNFDCYLRVKLSRDPNYRHELWGRAKFGATIPGGFSRHGNGASGDEGWFPTPNEAIDDALLYFVEYNADTYSRDIERAEKWRDLVASFRVHAERMRATQAKWDDIARVGLGLK